MNIKEILQGIKSWITGDYARKNEIPDVTHFITRTVNDLANYYLKSETYSKAEVQALIGAINQFHYEVYDVLPARGESNVLYLIGPTGSGADKYEEYVYADGAFVKIGDTSINLSGYVTTQALNTALAGYTNTADLTSLLATKQTAPFIASYGNTTYAQILAAKQAGKEILCSYGTFPADYVLTHGDWLVTLFPLHFFEEQDDEENIHIAQFYLQVEATEDTETGGGTGLLSITLQCTPSGWQTFTTFRADPVLATRGEIDSLFDGGSGSGSSESGSPSSDGGDNESVEPLSE